MSENEKIYYENGGVTVTKSRFIVHGQTYTMNGVTSVRDIVDQPWKGQAFLGFLGLVLLLSGDGGAILFGLLLIAGAIFWFIKAKKYLIFLSSASGEVQALSNSDSGFIKNVVSALNQAIVDRG